QKNLAFSFPQEIISVFKKELPNNPVLNLCLWGKLRLPTLFEKVSLLRPNWPAESGALSILSTDISTKNKMAVVFSFWDGKLNSEMLKMKHCKDATAEGLFTAL
ncbi:Uncharacterized protein APZ42_007030, partial [Daphnia magna]